MADLKMTLDEMISSLDTACGMLIVTAVRDRTVREAMEMVTRVSIALGEMAMEEHAPRSGKTRF